MMFLTIINGNKFIVYIRNRLNKFELDPDNNTAKDVYSYLEAQMIILSFIIN